MDYQFDAPMTARAFVFHCFESIQKAHLLNKGINKKLFTFYVKNPKPQFESWRLERIVRLKVKKPMTVDGYLITGLK